MFIPLQVFDDAYKSPLSCVIVDDIDQLLGGWGLLPVQLTFCNHPPQIMSILGQDLAISCYRH